jgi:hypothetical protein
MMRSMVAAIALLLATGVSAQTPPEDSHPQRDDRPGQFDRSEMRRPPGPPDFERRGGPGGPSGPGGPDGPGGFGGPHHMPPPPPSKAAHFRMRSGTAAIDIKCADDEPTKACADAASQLIDKLSAVAPAR